MSRQVRVTIAVTDDHIDRMTAVVERLRSAGVSIEQTLDAAGAIIGSVDEATVDELAHITGVAGVEREGQVQLPPPDSLIH